ALVCPRRRWPWPCAPRPAAATSAPAPCRCCGGRRGCPGGPETPPARRRPPPAPPRGGGRFAGAARRGGARGGVRGRGGGRAPVPVTVAGPATLKEIGKVCVPASAAVKVWRAALSAPPPQLHKLLLLAPSWMRPW